jgi:hypothetical protein
MAEHNRRAFLRSAGLGAAAVGAAAVIPAQPADAASRRAAGLEASLNDVPAGASLVAHVRDPKAGTIALMMGDREVVITDRALTAQLLHAVR